MARKRDDTVKLVLRLPPTLHRELKRQATRSNQSLNTVMIRGLHHLVVTGGLRELRDDVSELVNIRRRAPKKRDEIVEKIDRLLEVLPDMKARILKATKDEGEGK